MRLLPSGTRSGCAPRAAFFLLTRPACEMRCRTYIHFVVASTVHARACDAHARQQHVGLQVTFQFKLTDGACPKSYGPTVARAAGIPASIAERAIAISEAFEANQLSTVQPPDAALAASVAAGGAHAQPDASMGTDSAAAEKGKDGVQQAQAGEQARSGAESDHDASALASDPAAGDDDFSVNLAEFRKAYKHGDAAAA